VKFEYRHCKFLKNCSVTIRAKSPARRIFFGGAGVFVQNMSFRLQHESRPFTVLIA